MTALTTTDECTPRNWTEAKRDLKCRKGSRVVKLTYKVTPREYRSGLRYDVQGPTAPGEFLTVYVNSGMLHLNITGGNVLLFLGSPWGNAATVQPEARDTTEITVFPGIKAHIYGADPARTQPSVRTSLRELTEQG